MKKISIGLLIPLVIFLCFFLTSNAFGDITVSPEESIQAAIDASPIGGTIVVRAGSYTEDLVIEKALTLISESGPLSTSIQGINFLPGASSPMVAPNIDIKANNVTISGFTIMSPSIAEDQYSSGIVLTGTNVEIINNNFQVATGTSPSFAIMTWYNLGDISGLLIKDNTFNNLTPIPSGNPLYEAIYISSQLDPTDINNPVIIENNTFSGQLIRGIAVDREHVIIQNNTLSTTGETFSFFPRGVQVQAANVTIVNNFISGFEQGIAIDLNLYSDSSVAINNNSISGNNIGVKYIGDPSVFTVDATYNWWGDPSGPSCQGCIGLGDWIDPEVRFIPFLTLPLEMLCNGIDDDNNPVTPDDKNTDGDPVSYCNGDCDDTDPLTYPGAPEVCDGVDNNCDGAVDENNVCNEAPDAADDGYTTDEDTPLNVAAPGVLGNDTDADGDALSAVLVSGTSNGTLTLNADGSFDYTPNANFSGTDSFTYVANDGTVDSNTATVTITINPDSDEDGIVDASDNCPDTYNPLQENSDGDAMGDACDSCPLDSDNDIDGDGVCGNIDICPSDPFKTDDPGQCGCGIPETDIDNDGKEDCVDLGNASFAQGRSNGADYVSFWSGELRIFAQEPGTKVYLIDIDTNELLDLNTDPRISSTGINGISTSDNPFTLSTEGDKWAGVGGIGSTISEIRVRIVADKPVTVWTGSSLNSASNAWGSLLPSSASSGTTFGSEVGREFVGFIQSSMVIVAPTDPSVSLTTVTINNLALATTTTLNLDGSIPVCSNDNFPPGPPATCYMVDNPEVQVLFMNGFGDNRAIISSNVDVTVLTGNKLFTVDDWSYTPPSFAAGDNGTELGTLYYFPCKDSITIFPTQDNTTVQIFDLSDGDDTRTFSLTSGYPGGVEFEMFSTHDNSMTARSSSPHVKIIHSSGNLIDNDILKVVSDKPILIYAGPPSRNSGEMVDVAHSVPAGLNSWVAYAYAQNFGNSNDLQLFAFQRDTQVRITSLTSTQNFNGGSLHDFDIDFNVAPGTPPLVSVNGGSFSSCPNSSLPTCFSLATPGDIQHFGSGIWSGELVRIESNNPIAVMSGDIDNPNFGAFIPYAAADADGDGVILGPDCDDNDDTIYPGNIEICDGLDNNCNGAVDENNVCNTAPAAADDMYTTDEDIPLNVAAPGVLGNDTDVDGDALSAVLVSGTSNGTLTLNADGSFDYTPNANFSGTDSFTYVANDGPLYSNVSTVTITVNALELSTVAGENSIYARVGATAIVLNDGSVLFAGVQTPVLEEPVSASEIYDLRAGKWFATEPEPNGISFIGAAGALLHDGRAVIIGGSDAYGNIHSILKIYDVVNQRWNAYEFSMLYKRSRASATVLPDGRVLIAGGIGCPASVTPCSIVDAPSLDSVEILDPQNGFSAIASMATSRYDHTATLLPNGSVVIAGGFQRNGTLPGQQNFPDSVTATVEVFDSNTLSWQSCSNSLTDARAAHTAHYVSSTNTIYYVGGTDESEANTVSGPIEAYQVSSGGCSEVASVIPPLNGDAFINRWLHTSTLLPNGKIMIAGGIPNASDVVGDSSLSGGSPDKVVQIFDPINQSISDVSSNGPRYDHIAVLLMNGKVLIANGMSADFNPTTETEIYDPARPRFCRVSSMVDSISDGSASLLPDGNVVVAFGMNGTTATSDVRIFDGSTISSEMPCDGSGGIWSSPIATGLTGRTDAPALLLKDGMTYFFGGRDTSGLSLGEIVRWNDATETMELVASMTPRYQHTVTELSDGRVLIAGGIGPSGTVLNSYQIFDPVSQTITADKPDMLFQRKGHTATLLYEGNVLIVGGLDDAGIPLSAAVKYNVDTDAFEPAGDIATARSGHTAILLPKETFAGAYNPTGSKVIIAFGENSYNEDISSYQIYDELTGSWLVEGYASGSRGPGHVATLMDNGKVLYAGGVWGEASPESMIDLFDPEQSGFSVYPVSTNTATTYNYLVNPVVLNSGQVLLAGGMNETGPTSEVNIINDGLNYSDDTRPVISSVGLSANAGEEVAIDGIGFVADSDSGSSLAVSNTSTNFPIARFTRVNDGIQYHLPASSYSSTYALVPLPGNMITGHYRLTVVVNGIPSISKIIYVGAHNSPPIADDINVSTSEDDPTTVTLSAADADGDPLTFSIVTGPAHGTLSGVEPDLVYLPGANFNGEDSFTYKANDGIDDSNIATVTIMVNPANDAPVADDDAYTIDEDSSLNVTAPGVLANDTDVDGDPITAILLSGPANGTLTLNADGSFDYTPNANFNGTDSFIYKVSDGTMDSNAATVIIDVSAGNDSPAITITSPPDGFIQTVGTPTLFTGTAYDEEDGDISGSIEWTSNQDGYMGTGESVSFELSPPASGIDYHTITAEVTDSSGAAVSTSITVRVNWQPRIEIYFPNDGSILDEEADYYTFGAIATDEEDGDIGSSVQWYSDRDGLVGTGDQAVFSLSVGNHTITALVTDSDGSIATASIAVTVDAAPVLTITAPTDGSVQHAGELVEFSATALDNEDGDLSANIIWTWEQDEFDPLETGSPVYGTFPLHGTDNEIQVVTAEVYDSRGQKSTSSISVRINNAPQLSIYSPADGAVYAYDQQISFEGSAYDDEDYDLTSAIQWASNLDGFIGSGGSFAATLSSGTHTISVTVTDSDGYQVAHNLTLTVNPPNTPPLAANDTYTTDEDTPLNVAAPGVLGNDTDVEGDALSVVLVSGTTNGTLTLNADGSFDYTPNVNFNGTDSFTYKANDGTDDSNTATVTITINAINDAPVANDDAYTTDEDLRISMNVLSNDTDAENDPLSVSVIQNPTNGITSAGDGGIITYVPNENFNGEDSFMYELNDGNGGTATATVTVTVNPVNDEPVVVADAYELNEDDRISVPAPGVRGNDTDVDGDIFGVILYDNVQHGTLQLNSDGSFIYVPNADFHGTDRFTYFASEAVVPRPEPGVIQTIPDRDPPVTATVTITVNPVNDAPSAADDAYTTDEDTPLNVSLPGVLTNDSDVEGNALTSAVVTYPSNGVLALNPEGSFSYTANENFNGTDSFTYKANDGELDSNEATVTITVTYVNDVPTITDIADQVTDEDVAIVDLPFTIGDLETAVESLTMTASSDNPTLLPDGSITLGGSGAARTLTITPAPNQSGTATVTVTVTDADGGTISDSFVLTVNAVNDPPVIGDDIAETNEDVAVIIPVLKNDSDPEDDPLTTLVIDAPLHGTAEVNADWSITYTPDKDFNGEDQFIYGVEDGNGGGAKGVVRIIVRPVNDPPVAVADEAVTDEDTSVMIDILANDYDVDGDEILLSPEIRVEGKGTAIVQEDRRTVLYFPDKNFYGQETLLYTIGDAFGLRVEGIVTVTVNPVNDSPVAANDIYTTDEDTTLVVASPGLLGNDTDVENDPLTAVLVSGTSNGTLTLNSDGSFMYSPDANFNGTDSFTYMVNDGLVDSNTATVTITVNAVNDPVVAADDAYTTDEDTQLVVAAPGILANDTDVEGDPLQLLVHQPAHGAVSYNNDGSFTYTPAPNFHGSDSFNYEVYDTPDSVDYATVTITVNSINDAPVAADDSYMTNEDTSLVVVPPGLLGNDSDEDGDSITSVLVSGTSHGALTLNTNGSFTYMPNANFNGTDSFTYKANDGLIDSNIATVAITINPVNDTPVAVDDSYTTDEDTPLIVSAPGVLGNDIDVEGDPLMPALLIPPSHGTLELNADGSFTYTPNENYHGSDFFTYHESDGHPESFSDEATVHITIRSINDTPVATDDSYTTDEDIQLVVAAPGILANDSDVDGDALASVLVSGTSNGTLTLNSDGSFMYSPDANFNGTDSFTYNVNDGTVDSSIATVTITVNPVNDPVVAADDAYTTDEDTPLVVSAPGILANDTDVEDDPLQLLVHQPTHGTLTYSNDGSFTYTPSPNFHGADRFNYEVYDTPVSVDYATVTITVNSINDAPVANDDSYTTDEDTSLVVAAPGLLGNDSDVDGDALTSILLSGTSNGTLTLNADGSFTYSPDANFNGTDSFTYVANDGIVDSNVATVTITVNSVNDAPVAASDAYTTDEDTPLNVAAPGLLANDTDIDGDPLTAILVTGTSNGTLALNADGSLSYTPNANFNGTDSFTYKANDGLADSNIATVTITVISINDAPVAIDDSYITNEDTALNATAPGLLANDSDVDGDALTSVLVTGPNNGTLILNADGSFGYTPDLNYNGPDSFTYVAKDGLVDSNIAMVTITVNAVNDAPVVSADIESQTIQYSDGISPVTISASDIDSSVLTVTTSWTSDGGTTVNPGLPDGLSLNTDDCNGTTNVSCARILDGTALASAGTYVITVTFDDGEYQIAGVTTIVIETEDTEVVFDDDNPVAIRVASDGGNSGDFSLTVHINERYPDLAAIAAYAGDIGLADVSMKLTPVGPGGSVSGTCTVDTLTGTGYDAVKTVSCGFTNVEVNTYTVEALVGGGYYHGYAEDVLTVYDPSLGFATGGGWFYWPGTNEKTNFGFTMKYNKKATSLQGSLLMIRHLPDGTIYRIKSNALYGLALGESSDAEGYFGWASFSGKTTYKEPGWIEPMGNYEFITYIEDRNEPGNGVDRIWIQVIDKDRIPVSAMSMPEPSVDNTSNIDGGNLIVPHGGF